MIIEAKIIKIFFMIIVLPITGIYGQDKILSSLPDPLIMKDGTFVETSEQWYTQRRPELLDVFSHEMYGESPLKPKNMRFEVFDNDSNALSGKATRRQVRIEIEKNGKEMFLDVLIYLPNQVKKGKIPVIVGLNFGGNHTIHIDPAIKLAESWLENRTVFTNLSCVKNNRATEACRGINANQWPVEKILERGYALVTVYREDIASDQPEKWLTGGVHALYPEFQEGEDNFGTIAAWAWGMSRIVDYLETDRDIDSKRIALFGWSRLGKAALWAGACDIRFSLVISNGSGAGGAKIFRRNIGENISRLCTIFPHWYSKSFRKYMDKDSILPFDQHQILSLIAPRPVYISSAQDDNYADPSGEFMSALAANKVYRFLGTEGLLIKEMPLLNNSTQGRIGYHIRTGKHDVTAYDWEQYLDFLDKKMMFSVQVKKENFKTSEHPRIFATQQDRQNLQLKIKQNDWTQKLYKEIVDEVGPLVKKHTIDPQYIISRMQMNWEEGKHYTDFYTEGNFIPRREGNAPYPTVRLTYGRAATNTLQFPPIERIPPYGNGALPKQDENGSWRLISFEETAMSAETYNQKILHLAYQAAIVYYLTEDKDYAKFAADILWTFVRGASYHNEVNPNQIVSANGYMSFETLGDTRRFCTLPLAYDFIYNYLQNEYFESEEFKKGRDGELWAPGHSQGKAWAMNRFEIMFKKLIENKLNRGGGLMGNWNTNEHQSAMLYALALDDNDFYEDGKGREYYINSLIYGPTTHTHGAYIDVIRSNLNNDTGLWPEPPQGYGQGSISQLVRFGFIYFINGIDLLNHDPLLKKAVVSYPQIAFPNGITTNWGDGNYTTTNTDHAELMTSYARRKGDKEMAETFMTLLAFAGERKFIDEFYYALFFYEPDITFNINKKINYPITSYSADHSIIFQRNKPEDSKNALAFTLSGYGKNSSHRNANGLNMELYGRGHILGIDPGWGINYWSNDHTFYNSNVAAHNTVVPNGKKADLDKPMDLKILHTDPTIHPGKEPDFIISENNQFTEVYNDFVTSELEARQRRLMSIVRTGKESGYYVDIFRSEVIGNENEYHDYIYHNQGVIVRLYNAMHKLLPLTDKPLKDDSGYGYSFFENDQSLQTDQNITAVFEFGMDNVHMAAWSVGNQKRTIYQLTAPPTFRYYLEDLKKQRVPTLLIRQQGEAWKRPFITVYEPYGNGTESSVQSVRRINNTPLSSDFAGIVVTSKSGREDYIMNCMEESNAITYENVLFKGIYGIISNQEGEFIQAYLGNAIQIETNGFGLESCSGKPINAYLQRVNDEYIYSSDDEVVVKIKYPKSKQLPKVIAKTKTDTFDAISVIQKSDKENKKEICLEICLPKAIRASLNIY